MKLKKLKILDSNILTPNEMRMIDGGGYDTYTCRTGASCNLFVPSLGATLQGYCHSEFASEAKCFCVNGVYRTDPDKRSICWSQE